MAKDHLPLNVEPSVAFTAGLLHDIGKLALNEVLTEEDLITMRSCIREKSQSYAEAEQQVLGFDHAEVGACLLKAWKLPAEIVEAVAHHHHPVCRPRLQLSALVHAADCVAHEMGANFGRDAFAVRVDGQVADALQLTPERMDGFMLAIHDALPQADCLEKLA
jgi:putative nucleotidyltransferase with HDIG domain